MHGINLNFYLKQKKVEFLYRHVHCCRLYDSNTVAIAAKLVHLQRVHLDVINTESCVRQT